MKKYNSIISGKSLKARVRPDFRFTVQSSKLIFWFPPAAAQPKKVSRVTKALKNQGHEFHGRFIGRDLAAAEGGRRGGKGVN